MHLAIAKTFWLGSFSAAALLLAPPAWGDESPLIGAPSQRLSDVLPQHVLDTIEVPTGPIRVAARPTLDWRPGLRATSDRLNAAEQTPAAKGVEESQPQPKKPANATSKPAPEPEPDKLQPVLVPPRLVAPSTARSEESATKANDRPEVEADPAPEATADLPLLAPRSKPKAEPKSAPSEEVASDPIATDDEVVLKEPSGEAKADAPNASKPKATTPKTKQPAKEKSVRKPAVKPSEPPAPLTRGLRNLRSRMRTVLSFYYRKPLNTVEHNPWELMHSMLSYELHSRVRDGGPRGPYMTAVGHLCFNRPSKRQRMMTLTRDGKIDTRIGVGLQGHKGQLLAMLAQCNVSPEYPIRVQNKDFTIEDLIDSEKLSCYSKTELTFKLIGLGHYLTSDASWLNDRGERWDIPRLIKEEREQPIRGAACGGTHRLAGLSLAFRRREARGEPVDGEYAEAARFVSQYQGYAFRLQNPDGSLSTEWFRGRGAEEDKDRRLRTTGHLLEWLVYSLPDEELRSHRTVRAVNYLTTLLATNADHEWHLGSIAHAIHALVLYDKRVFRPHDAADADLVAEVDPTGRLFRGYPIYRNVMRNSPPERSTFFGGLFGGSRTGSAAGRRR